MAEPVLTVQHLGKTFPLHWKRPSVKPLVSFLRGTIRRVTGPVDSPELCWVPRDVSFSIGRGEIGIGMATSLSLAMATHLDSEIILIDDVFRLNTNAFVRRCIAKLRDEASIGGRAALVVSQDLGTSWQLCTRTIVLETGKIDGYTEGTIEHRAPCQPFTV